MELQLVEVVVNTRFTTMIVFSHWDCPGFIVSDEKSHFMAFFRIPEMNWELIHQPSDLYDSKYDLVLLLGL